MRIISPSASITCRSGCVRASTRRGSPSSSPASACAATRLPTPAGPWKRYACAGPSASAASSRRFASSCSGTSAKVAMDLLGELVDGTRAVDDDVPSRVPRRERRGTPRRRAPRGPRRRARSGRRCRRPRAAAVSGPISTSTVRSGMSPPTTVRLSSSTVSTPRRRAAALVRGGRVDVAVADDRRAALERGPDHLVDVLRPRPPRRARPPPRARHARRGGRGRGRPRRAACRPARG